VSPRRKAARAARPTGRRAPRPRDAVSGAAGQVLRRSAAGTAGTTIGQEIDLLINFHLDNHQGAPGGWSHLFAGELIRATAPNIRAGRDPDFCSAQHTYRWRAARAPARPRTT
jgi:hypothetical protein